jgi:hypothetical protein
LREIEANSRFHLTKAHADLDRFRRFCSRFTTFQTRSQANEVFRPSLATSRIVDDENT